MSRAWIRGRKRDPYYRKAKRKGYRSRAAYKLRQINQRFRVIRPGDVVVDLGAAPGGWSQLSRELVGRGGKVLALDLVPMAPIDDVTFLQGDITEEPTIARLLQLSQGGVDCVLSDAAPKLSGNRSLDHARSVGLAEAALQVAERSLKSGGNFVTKLFQGDEYKMFLRRVAEGFASCKGFTPPASPDRSAEIYVVAKGWRGSVHSQRKL